MIELSTCGKQYSMDYLPTVHSLAVIIVRTSHELHGPRTSLEFGARARRFAKDSPPRSDAVSRAERRVHFTYYVNIKAGNMSQSMEAELQKQHKISYAIAHTCVVGAKKQLGITSDDEAQGRRNEVMQRAEQVYQNLPTTKGEVSSAQPFFPKTTKFCKSLTRDTTNFLQEKFKMPPAKANECVEGAKKKHGITSDEVDEDQEKEVIETASQIYESMPDKS